MWSGTRIAMACVAVVVVVGGVVAWRVLDDGDRGVHRTAWHLTAQPADSIAVAAAFGGCQRWNGWTVRETDSTVAIEAREWSSGSHVCPTNLGVAQITFVLQQPLGTRRLSGCVPNNDHADCTNVAPPR
jgi:hypothetical protein